MQRRQRPGKRPSSSSFRWLWWLAGLLLVGAVILVLLAPTLVISYIRSYVQTDDFRQKSADLIAARTGGTAHIAPITWSDDTATAADLSLETPDWTMDAGGLHAALDFDAIRRGKWSIQNAGADEVTFRRTAAASTDSSSSSARSAKFDDSGDGIPSFLRRYIPTQTSINGFDVHRFFFEQAGWKVADTQMRLGNWQTGEVSVSAKLTGGKLLTPINAPEQKEPLGFDLTKATLRLGSSQVQISDAALRWKQESTATLRGSLKLESGTWQTFVHVKGVPLDEFLDAWWKQRLSGKVEGDLEMSGARNAPPAWKADLALKDGALTGLPILDKLVTYTNTQRFKRIVLDICSATFRPQGDSLRIENIVIQSNGLLRIDGALNIRGRTIEGDFLLGVTPETLSGIPGASSRVFVESNPSGPAGMHWARVHIIGTLDAPQEDLSSRLIGAAGMSLLFDTPGAVVEKGAEVLLKPVLGEDLAKMPAKVIQGAGGVLENGVSTGSGLINKVLPIFPGK